MTGSPDTDTVEPLLQAYLDRVATGLRGSRRHRGRILAELRDGLDEAITNRHSDGLPAEQAIAAAITSFGTAEQVAAAFAGELATAYARRVMGVYVVTGPLVGICWLRLLVRTDAWAAGPAGLVAAIPALPLVAAGLAIIAGTLATTGPLMRWLPETGPRRALAATTAVASLTAIGDLLVIAVSLRSVTLAGPLAVLAVTGSLARIGCGLLVIRHSVALRRQLT